MVESWPPEKLFRYYDVATRIIAAENGTADAESSDTENEITDALGFEL